MKKILSLILVLALSVFVFAACGADKAEENAAGDVADVKTETIKMGTNAAFPPYEYKDGEKFVGIDVEIADAIAKELGRELEIVDM